MSRRPFNLTQMVVSAIALVVFGLGLAAVSVLVIWVLLRLVCA